jgi:hypothetical protein
MKFSYKDTMTGMIKNLKNAHQGSLEKALTIGGLALWQDTVNESPKPPVDTGNLRGSGALFVNSKDKSSMSPVGSRAPGVTTSHQTKQNAFVFGLDTPYAARLHEMAPYKTHRRPEANSDSGPKFLESKVVHNKDEYAEIVAREYFKNAGIL